MDAVAVTIPDEETPRARLALLLKHFSKLGDDREPWRVMYPLKPVGRNSVAHCAAVVATAHCAAPVLLPLDWAGDLSAAGSFGERLGWSGYRLISGSRVRQLDGELFPFHQALLSLVMEFFHGIQ